MQDNEQNQPESTDAQAAPLLDPVEIRILGSLIEKACTTPDQYPLTLNALKLACNQKSNRDPVTTYDEQQITRGLETLREKDLAIRSSSAGSRATKFKHCADRCLNLAASELAILCVLFLRGPQTLGEIKGRTGRIYSFESPVDVQEAIEEINRRAPNPFISSLPKEAGRKEPRYIHLLGDLAERDTRSTIIPGEGDPAVTNSPPAVTPKETKVAELESRIESLEEKLAGIERRLEE